MNLLFTFHFVALVLFLTFLLVAYQNKKVLLAIAGILSIFAFHCFYFGATCLRCDITNSTCLLEILLFWLFVLFGIAAKEGKI